MPCAFCEFGTCIDPGHLVRQRLSQRDPIKSLPSAKDYRARRREKSQLELHGRRLAVFREDRSGNYMVSVDGVFEGTYLRRDGVWVTVRGSTVAGVRWEREANSRRWRRVPYKNPT
jgi:hypothetical protein